MAAPLARLFPPGDGRPHTTVANGRPYSGMAGGVLDAPVFDANVLQANGWIRVGAHALSGPTAARPAAPIVDQLYFDTTLTLPVVWDVLAKVWRNVWTGAPA
ncbi:hypothetical protein [Methylobacterium brachiatum]|jgi:hypothetical protein|uniref:hypothetical protein n=1 Tax=Methylobacterium brachiatum TaxID=269660 RepID=UPI000EFB535E|nr:hypothetical protein [Methylobacterium brachiatum]AYO81589.1 hypothetical protein EBB05_04400 [Methylobacterium brachiatum]